MFCRRFFLIITLLSSTVASSAWQDFLTVSVMKNSGWTSRIGGGALAGVGAVACSLSLPAVVASALLGSGIGHLWDQNEKTTEVLRGANQRIGSNTSRMNDVGAGLQDRVGELRAVDATLVCTSEKVATAQKFQDEARVGLSGVEAESRARNEKIGALNVQLARMDLDEVAAREELELRMAELKKQQAEAARVATESAGRDIEMNRRLRDWYARRGVEVHGVERSAVCVGADGEIQVDLLANLNPVVATRVRGALKKPPAYKGVGAVSALMRISGERGSGAAGGRGSGE